MHLSEALVQGLLLRTGINNEVTFGKEREKERRKIQLASSCREYERRGEQGKRSFLEVGIGGVRIEKSCKSWSLNVQGRTDQVISLALASVTSHPRYPSCLCCTVKHTSFSHPLAKGYLGHS